MSAAQAEAITWGPIHPDDHFPDLQSAELLYPDATPMRPDLSSYAQGLALQGRLNSAVEESIAKALELQGTTSAIVYLAGPLTGVSEELKARYGQLSDLLSTYAPVVDGMPRAFFGYAPHLHGTDPVKHPDVSSETVRDIDKIWGAIVPSIAINCLFPTAHGNAIEAGWEESSMVPAIFMNPTGNKLSRLTTGLNNIIRVIEYDDFETDGIGALKVQMDEIHAWMQHFPGRDPREFFYLNFPNIRKPLLLLNDLDPTGFHPVFSVDDEMVYINDPTSPHYGKAGDVLWHDWQGSGDIALQFEDGSTTTVHDQSEGFSYWRKMPPVST